MYIISPFKDFYDFVGTQYGIDKKITYVRNKTTELNVIFDYFSFEIPFKLLKTPLVNFNYRDKILLKWLVVTGKYYLLIADIIPGCKTKFRLLSQEDFVKYIAARNRSYDNFIGVEDSSAVKLSKILKSPVFCAVTENNFLRQQANASSIKVDINVPCLAEFGLTKLLDPFTLYQDISYYVTNVLNDSPDTQPPVEVDNKNKILQHGFDLKQSFRHRM